MTRPQIIREIKKARAELRLIGDGISAALGPDVPFGSARSRLPAEWAKYDAARRRCYAIEMDAVRLGHAARGAFGQLVWRRA